MDNENIIGHGDFNAQGLNAPVNKSERVKIQTEKMAQSSYYSNSTIQKSDTEALVLALAAGFPVLQPPPKTQTKNSYEASATSVGGSAGPAGAQVPAAAATHPPAHSAQTKKASSLSSNEVLNLETVIKFVRTLLAILVHETNQSGQLNQDEAAYNQLDRLILSAMAMHLLYQETYGGMTSEEFADLLTNDTVEMPEQIKSTMDKLKAIVNANLPQNPAARAEMMSTLKASIDQNIPFSTRVATMQVLAQKLSAQLSAQNVEVEELLSPLTNVQLQPQVQQTKNTLIDSMLTTYTRNLSEFASRMQGDDITQWLQKVSLAKANSPSEYYAIVLAFSATQNPSGTPKNNALIEKFNLAFNSWINQPNQHLGSAKVHSDPFYPSSSFLAGCVICGADVLRNSTKDMSPEAGLQSPKSPVADVLFAVGPTSNLAVDYLAAAALIAALLSNGAVYKATDDTLNKNANKDTPPKDLDFAINYARNIIAIVTYKSAAKEILNKEIQEQNRLVRLMLSAMALNMLYRAAYGGMTGEEFGSVLKGETQDLPEKIKPLIDQLAFLIKANLSSNEKSRTETIIRLMDYVDTKDSIDSMLQSTQILKNLLPSKDMERNRWEIPS